MKSFLTPFLDRLSRITAREIFLAFLLLALALYGNAISYPFVHDDHIFIVHNFNLGRWDDLQSIFSGPSAFLSPEGKAVNLYYRPVLEVVNKVLFVFFGRMPAGYHFFNIFLHSVNSLLAYFLVLSFSPQKFFALAVGILFLIHPVQSETVCAIAGISNLLSVFFCLTSFCAYLRARDLPPRQKNFPGAAALTLFACALFTKENTVIFPLLLAAYEFFGMKDEKKEGSRFKNLSLLFGFFVLLAGYFVVRRIIFSTSLPALGANPHELQLRLLSIPKTILMYLQILFFPYNLHYYRSVDILGPSFAPFATLALLGALAGVLLRYLSIDERRLALFALAWFFITLLPMMNILPLINEYSFILTAEHFLYFPFLGFAVFTAVVFWRVLTAIFKKNNRKIAVALFCFIVLVLSVQAKVQSYFWRGEVPLFLRTLQFEPNFGRVRLLLARAYYQNGDHLRAAEEYKKGLAVMEGYLTKARGTAAEGVYRLFVKEGYVELAECYQGIGRLPEAIHAYWQAQEQDPKDADIYNNLGVGYLKAKELEEAALCFKKALALKPDDIRALNNLAFYYLEKKSFSRAKAILEKALALDPASILTQRNLQEVLATEKKNGMKSP